MTAPKPKPKPDPEPDPDPPEPDPDEEEPNPDLNDRLTALEKRVEEMDERMRAPPVGLGRRS
jgi:hypothetical protein